MKKLEVVTDSAAICGWINTTLTGLGRIHTKGLNEVLVRWRHSLLQNTCQECGININMRLVNSAENKADKLTRVPELVDRMCVRMFEYNRS